MYKKLDKIRENQILIKLTTIPYIKNSYRSHLSIAQARSSFKHLDTCMFMYATPTCITAMHCIVTQVQLLLMAVTEN